MQVTVSEFRKDIKKYLEASLSGEPVSIIRGSIQYDIKARLPKNIPVPVVTIREQTVKLELPKELRRTGKVKPTITKQSYETPTQRADRLEREERNRRMGL